MLPAFARTRNRRQSPHYRHITLDYERSHFFLMVRRERSKKNRPRESWPHESCCLGERRKKRAYRQTPQRLTCLTAAFDFCLTAAVKIREIIGLRLIRFEMIGLRLIRFEMNTIKSRGHERSNAEALSVVPFFAFRPDTAFVRPTFALPVFFALLSTDYKKTKGLLVV